MPLKYLATTAKQKKKNGQKELPAVNDSTAISTN